MLNMLFGGPGTGKTRTVIERIRTDISSGAQKVYLLVPEQLLYSAESGVLPQLTPEAGKNLSILSFTRLCDVIADRFGGRSFGILTRASRTLLMWRTLRDLNGLLECGSDRSPDGNASLCRLMLDASDELSRDSVSPAALEQAARKLPSEAPLAYKLRDLALVSASFGNLVRELCGNDPSDRLLRTAQVLERECFFADAKVYIDSFTSFTAPEYGILRVLLSQTSSATITLCMTNRNEPGEQLESVRDTVRRLELLCDDLGIPCSDTVLPTAFGSVPPELRVLSSGLWRFGVTPDESCLPAPDDRGAVRLITAQTAYGEARAAALHIGELRNKGIPFGQIAVVVRDTADWRGVLDAALDNAHIPFFLSDRAGLSDRPAIRLLLLALRCIRRGYPAEDVVSLCKTGLCGITLPDLDAFSEYTETWQIRGKHMSDLSAGDWSMNPDGFTVEKSERGREILSAANRVRHTVIPPLAALETDLAVADSPTEQCRALFRYLNALNIKDALATSSEALLLAGKTREAGETARLWTLLTGALAELSVLLPDEEGAMSMDELSAALELYFSETDMGSVPARHDCVTVGSAATLRLENVSAVLILGLCEGEFPKPVSDHGLLTEQDKQTLEDLGIEFNDHTPRRMAEELLFIWRAVVKPTRELLLFTHTAKLDGSSCEPSLAFKRVQYLLPYLEPIRFPDRFEDEETAPYRPPVHDALSPTEVRRVLSNRLWLSHTSMQSYARCPYSYFGSKVLKLRAPAEARISTAHAGTFLHHVMEVFLRSVLDADHHIRPISDEETVAITDRIINEYMIDLCGDTTGNGRILHLFARLRHIALILVRTVRAELEQSSFTVAGLEWDTRGRRAEDPSPLEIPIPTLQEPLPGGYESPLPDRPNAPHESETETVHVLLGGKIDRVDIYRDGDIAYIRVIDYKSSPHFFSEKRLWEEMNVQLLLYLFTLCSPVNRRLFADANGNLPEAVLPAEVLYLSPEENTDGVYKPVRSGLILNREEVLHAASTSLLPDYLPGIRVGKNGELTGTSLCAPEHFQELDDTLRKLIRCLAEAIYSGKADRTPSEQACQYCPMRLGCPVAAPRKAH